MKSRQYNKKLTKNIISVNGRANSEPIPVDLVIEIFSRLPGKSITRCRCLSKLWASILGRPYFTELYLTRSHARPQLLFIICRHETGEFYLYSSPQPQYWDENSSSLARASYLTRIPAPSSHYHEPMWHSNGLVCLEDRICNPSTRQSLFLPKRKVIEKVRYTIVYDPIEKQFKVLSVEVGTRSPAQAYQVLTLGTKKMSWRKVECCIPSHRLECFIPSHRLIDNKICINGVLYHEAYGSESNIMIVVCFDIRSEKLTFIKTSDSIGRYGTLINYKGKLGSLESDDRSFFSGTSKGCVLWILEDAEKHDWSKRVHVLPPMWKDLVGDFDIDVAGMIGENEILFSQSTHDWEFYVFYYNIERNTIRRVEIQGMERWVSHGVQTFVNHVQDIKSIHGY